MKFNVSTNRRWKEVSDGTEQDLAIATTLAMGRIATGLKTDLRGQVVGAGMGTRLANTWRGRVYPGAGKTSIDATAYVKSNASDIITAFDQGATIVPVNGAKFLAIPTANVPRTSGQGRGGQRRMTPAEAEAHFGQKLHFAPAGEGRFVAYVITAKGSRGRKPQHLALFVLTPAVKLQKRFDVDGTANKWAAEVQELLDQELEGIRD